MARSIRINELTEFGTSSSNLPAGGFWEHWFDTQSPGNAVGRNLDEHKVWEKAVCIGVLAIKDSKR